MLVPGLFIISHPSMPVLEVLESLNLGAPLLKLVYRPVYSRTKKRKALSAASSKAPGPKYAKFLMPRGSVAQSKKYCIYRCFFWKNDVERMLDKPIYTGIKVVCPAKKNYCYLHLHQEESGLMEGVLTHTNGSGVFAEDCMVEYCHGTLSYHVGYLGCTTYLGRSTCTARARSASPRASSLSTS